MLTGPGRWPWTALLLWVWLAAPAAAQPVIGHGPLIGLARGPLVATFQQAGWKVTAHPPEGSYLVKAFAAEADQTMLFAHLDRAGRVVGVSVLVGKEDSSYVHEHMDALSAWVRGTNQAVPVTIEHDDDGESIAEVDIGVDTDAQTGAALARP